MSQDLFDRSSRAYADAVEAQDYAQAERMLTICFTLGTGATVDTDPTHRHGETGRP